MKTLLVVVMCSLAVLFRGTAGAKGLDNVETLEVTLGQPCALDAFNGQSVWVGNELVVVNGTETIVTEGVEDAPNIDTVVLFWAQGETIDVFVQGDEWSSLKFSVDCASSTTTTAPEPTTTTEPEPSTTSTTTPPPPETSMPSTTPPTTPNPTTTPTTTPPEPSTTTVPDPSSTTTPQHCRVPDECLPETGIESPLIVLSGLALLIAGSIFELVRWHLGPRS